VPGPAIVLGLLLLLAADGQDAVGHVDLYLVPLHAGEFGGDLYAFGGLGDINRGGDVPLAGEERTVGDHAPEDHFHGGHVLSPSHELAVVSHHLSFHSVRAVGLALSEERMAI